jgi:mono/diheme cytochrome c family protein
MRATLKPTLYILCLLALLCAIAISQDQAPKASSLAANPVYKQNCAKCHGDAAEGRHFRGPSLVPGKTATASHDDLRTIITDGKHHMPKFGGKLSAADIDTLVDQIKASNLK